MSEPLTETERQVYFYLIDYLAEHTYQPSVRDIAGRFGIKSTRTVSELLRSLTRKGYIQREGTRSRGLRLLGLDAGAQVVPVALYSDIALDQPTLRAEHALGHIVFERRFVPNEEVFALRVDAAVAEDAPGILEGDVALIDPLSPATDGSSVLARIGTRHAIRSIAHRGALMVLLPLAGREEIAVGQGEDYEVIGLVCAVFRTGVPV